MRKISELLAGMVSINAQEDREVKDLCLDSRNLKAGDLFLACAGGSTHGAMHIDQAIAAGASAVLWEPHPDCDAASIGKDRSIPIIAVANLSQQLGHIASRFFDHPSADLLLIGITGTDGKTTCTQLIAQLMDHSAARCAVLGTLGYGLPGALQTASHTTPDAVYLQRLLRQLRSAGARSVVMEVSSHALDQGRVNGIQFDIVGLTNLTRDHLDYHGDIESYAAAKQRLFEIEGVEYAIINRDDPFSRRLEACIKPEVQIIEYGFSNSDSHASARNPQPMVVAGSDLRLSAEGIGFTVTTADGSARIESTLLGAFNASNLLCVLSVLLAAGVPFPAACSAMASAQTIPGRMERFGGGPHQAMVVVDYAHTAEALSNALAALRPHCQGRLWCVFGCGGNRDVGKRALMGAAAEHYADCIVLTNDNPRHERPEAIIEDILAGIANPNKLTVEFDRHAAIELAIKQSQPEDVILIAGKGHEAYQLIGTERLPFSDKNAVLQILQGVH